MYGDLELALGLGRNTYEIGEPVLVALTVRNISDTTDTIEFPSGQRFDFVVSREGREIWRWSMGKAFIQVLRSMTIQPGETVRFEATWNQHDTMGRKIRPGEYEITGVLNMTGQTRPEIGPVKITIGQRIPQETIN